MSKNPFAGPQNGRGPRQETRIPPPLLDVYRGRGWERQRNQQAGKTKVTKSTTAEAPARWFFCWRFGRRGALRASLRQNGIDSIYGLTPGCAPCAPTPTSANSALVGAPRCRSTRGYDCATLRAGLGRLRYLTEAGANPSTGSGQALGRRASGNREAHLTGM